MIPAFPLRSLFHVWTCAALAVGASPGRAAPEEPTPARIITTVTDAARLWEGGAEEVQRVRIEGVVTGVMPSGAFRLHDGVRGIYVSKSTEIQDLKPRDRVVVSGVIRKGGYSPWLLPHEVVWLGTGAYPEAPFASYRLLASGVADNQWLEIEGVVRAVKRLDPPDFVDIALGMAGGNLRVLVNYSPGMSYPDLVDTRVRVRGVAAVSVDKHGHVVEPTFRVPSFSEIVVTKPAPLDAFDQPALPINRLMKVVTPDAPPPRVRTSGVVTRRMSDTVFLSVTGISA